MTDAEHNPNADDFERRVFRFERAWQQGNPPSISDFLEPSESPAERLRLLRELVCIDPESRFPKRPSRSVSLTCSRSCTAL